MSAVRVVVVDDNPMVRAGLRARLEVGDLQVVAGAGDGRQALAAVEAHRPEVTVLDYRMPVADGLVVLWQLADRTRDEFKNSPGAVEGWGAKTLKALVTHCIDGGLQCDPRGFDQYKPDRGAALDENYRLPA